jgi:hypothetical protein
MPDLEGSVGVDRPTAGLLTGDLVGVIGVTTFVPEKEKGWAEEANGTTGVEMTGVGVIGEVMERAGGEERVCEEAMGVGVMVEVTCVMGLGTVEEL